MRVRRVDDPVAFRDEATPFLSRQEARHNLLLGITSTLIAKPELYEVFDLWLVDDDRGVAGAALRTPPLNLVLAQPSEDAAMEALIERLVDEGQDLPGVNAAIPELETFVGIWLEEHEVEATRVFRHGIYELRDVASVPLADGEPRPVTPDDRELVITWVVAFSDEVLPADHDMDSQIRTIESRLTASDDGGIWIWEDEGRPVAFSGYGGATPSGIRIGPVYTPPDLRGRGYATSLVASQSRWLLENGRSFVFLYTDLDNPTSNALYRRIGYRMIAEAGEVRFDPLAIA